MHIDINKKNAVHELEKKISECAIAEDITSKAIESMETLKHHKVINKRIITAIKENGIYASLSLGYASRIVLYFPHDKRIYRVSDPDKNGVSCAEYYNETQVDIYFSVDDGYKGMMEASQARLCGIRDSRERYQRELEGIDSIIKEVESFKAQYAKIEEYSYIVRNVFGIK